MVEIPARSSESASAVGRETIALIERLGVAATPPHFEVCFAYVAGYAPGLKARMDARFGSGKPVDSPFLAELFEEFLAPTRYQAQVSNAGDRMLRELNDVMSALQASGDKTGAYAVTLQRASSSLEQSADIKGLKDLVSSLVAATVDMADHNKRLTRKLQETSDEIQTLRSNLDEARAQAMTDGLTGLANRKMFDISITEKVRVAHETGAPLSLMMCDIDYFKRFNDTWGHQTGDQIIRFIATVLPRRAAPEFVCARYGGEEFAVIMPGFDVAAARAFAEDNRAAIEAKKLLRKSTKEDLGRITISAGVAQLRPGETPEQLIERADALLYASKHAGRNRVSAETDSSVRTAA